MKNVSRMSKRNCSYKLVSRIFLSNEVSLFGVADLQGIAKLIGDDGLSFSRAISFAVPMNPEIMASIKQGPNRAYADEYEKVNKKINFISSTLVSHIKESGYSARAVPASERTDPIHILGDFPHKTAATRAGLGWIGRNCQLVTREHGPWLRLGTVFTNLPIKYGEPVIKSHCGSCKVCVQACPADAIVGNAWRPGVSRNTLLDVFRCDKWKKENYHQFHKGHICGICAAVCPFGK